MFARIQEKKMRLERIEQITKDLERDLKALRRASINPSVFAGGSCLKFMERIRDLSR